MSLRALLKDVRACTHCADHLPLGPRPVLRVAKTATVLIVGQAPGTRVHETGIPWNDRSGDRLRDWLGVGKETFYDETRIAIMPMGFCYPGVDKNGGDAPPRPECAPLWHGRLHAHLPNIKLTLLIGMYAQAYYLGHRRKRTSGRPTGKVARNRTRCKSSADTEAESGRVRRKIDARIAGRT